jgi:hypothetical protein
MSCNSTLKDRKLIHLEILTHQGHFLIQATCILHPNKHGFRFRRLWVPQPRHWDESITSTHPSHTSAKRNPSYLTGHLKSYSPVQHHTLGQRNYACPTTLQTGRSLGFKPPSSTTTPRRLQKMEILDLHRFSVAIRPSGDINPTESQRLCASTHLCRRGLQINPNNESAGSCIVSCERVGEMGGSAT